MTFEKFFCKTYKYFRQICILLYKFTFLSKRSKSSCTRTVQPLKEFYIQIIPIKRNITASMKNIIASAILIRLSQVRSSIFFLVSTESLRHWCFFIHTNCITPVATAATVAQKNNIDAIFILPFCIL